MSRLGVVNALCSSWIAFPPMYKSRAKMYDDSNISSSNYYDGTSNSNGCRPCSSKWECVYWALALLGIILVIWGAVLLGRSSDDPVLEFQVNSLEVTSMKIYNSNITNDPYSIVGDQKLHVTADFYFNMTQKNKDKEVMYLSPMQVSLHYHSNSSDDGEYLSSTKLEPYLLVENRRELLFGMRITDDDARLQDETLVDSVSQDLWGQHVVQFALKAQGDCVRWRAGSLQNCGFNLLCDDLKIGFSPSNNLRTGSMILSPLCKCKFDC